MGRRPKSLILDAGEGIDFIIIYIKRYNLLFWFVENQRIGELLETFTFHHLSSMR